MCLKLGELEGATKRYELVLTSEQDSELREKCEAKVTEVRRRSLVAISTLSPAPSAAASAKPVASDTKHSDVVRAPLPPTLDFDADEVGGNKGVVLSWEGARQDVVPEEVHARHSAIIPPPPSSPTSPSSSSSSTDAWPTPCRPHADRRG